MNGPFVDLDLTFVWGGILAFAVFAYVVMDGFDLGVGLLFQLLPPGAERDTAMNSVAPVWDGNETWLVLGGAGLMAAFPLAFAILLPALYAPLIAMLLGLVFRGVAFEFRWRDPRHRAFWDVSFAAGSLLATFAQGIVLGALVQGIDVEGRAYAGGWWNWLTPFSLLTGASLVAGYGLLGATWLVMKTEGTLQEKAWRFARPLAFATLLAIVAVSLATPFLEADYWRRWFTFPNMALAAPVPALVALAGWMLVADLAARRREVRPFLLSLFLFLLGFAGLGISIYPDIVPGAVSLAAAAAPQKSQMFMLAGALVMIPLILGYTAHAYWVFRGKAGAEGYH